MKKINRNDLNDHEISKGMRTSRTQTLLNTKKFKVLDEEKEVLNLNARLMKYKELEMIYQKTNIKPIYLLNILIVCIVLIIFGVCGDLLTCIIGVVYPMYYSIKTIKSGDREQVKQWLAYWY